MSTALENEGNFILTMAAVVDLAELLAWNSAIKVGKLAA